MMRLLALTRGIDHLHTGRPLVGATLWQETVPNLQIKITRPPRGEWVSDVRPRRPGLPTSVHAYASLNFDDWTSHHDASFVILVIVILPSLIFVRLAAVLLGLSGG